MDATAILPTVLHLLVFAYWLGGDIGVFYASTLLTDSARAPAGRLAAGKILADLDLAPRFCLLLALPTGLLLADQTGWLTMSPLWIGLVFVLALAWFCAVLRLHLRHGPESLRRLDFGLRIVFLFLLGGAAIAGFSDVLAIPLFLSLKLSLLAFCVLMGLFVRIALKPFAPAYLQLATSGPSEEADAVIRRSLSRARPAVVMIWIALVAAALLGVARPL